MELKRITILVDKFYSGDISPEEYEALLSAFKENEKFTPELENERRLFLALDACEPVIPIGFEKRLEASIEKRQNLSRRLFKTLISVAGAAILLICLTIGNYHINNVPSHSESEGRTVFIEKAFDKTNLSSNLPGKNMRLTVNSNQIVSKPSSDFRNKTNAVKNNKSLASEINNDELERAAQNADEALLSIISSIRMSNINVADRLEEIKIDQNMDF